MFKFGGYNFPLTMNIEKWGDIVTNEKKNNAIVRAIWLPCHRKYKYTINKLIDRYEVEVKVANVKLVNFIDYYLSPIGDSCCTTNTYDKSNFIKNNDGSSVKM